VCISQLATNEMIAVTKNVPQLYLLSDGGFLVSFLFQIILFYLESFLSQHCDFRQQKQKQFTLPPPSPPTPKKIITK
jgi:hypothetical protein